jgi:cytochrome P450
MQAEEHAMMAYTTEFLTNPNPLYAQLRASQPACRVRLPSGVEAWWITRYEDVAATLKDPRLTKNPRTLLPPEQLASFGSEAHTVFKLITSHMLYSDPPDHTRLRALVGKAFTPVLIERWRTRIQAITDELLDAVQDRGEMELIGEFAAPLPITLISEMLGVPNKDHQQFRAWSNVLIGNTSSIHQLLPVVPEAKAFTEYLASMIDLRRQHTTDDLISELIQAEEAGDRLSSDELVAMILLLLIAGHETTVNLIGNGVLALLQHPDQMRLLQQDPSLLKPAIEELLRYDPPAYSSTNRWAKEDMVIGGQLIRAGEMVIVMIGSANRDEQIFEHADELDITRLDNKHIAFGKGIHYCLGAPLARLEGQLAIGTLLRRMPNLRLAVEPQLLVRHQGILVHALEALPVTF